MIASRSKRFALGFWALWGLIMIRQSVWSISEVFVAPRTAFKVMSLSAAVFYCFMALGSWEIVQRLWRSLKTDSEATASESPSKAIK